MSVTVDHPECFDDKYAGWISKEGIVICGVNSPDHADFQDTLRHEGIHLAQRCKAYLNGLAGYKPSVLQLSASRSHQVLSSRWFSHPTYQRGFEAEAWYIASSRHARSFVDEMIRTHCSFAF